MRTRRVRKHIGRSSATTENWFRYANKEEWTGETNGVDKIINITVETLAPSYRC